MFSKIFKFVTLASVLAVFFAPTTMAIQTDNFSPIAFDKVQKQNFSQVRASHILVKTKQEALSLKDRIDKGESFEKLAAQYSFCPSGKSGGDLGFFGRGQMVPEFESAAFSAPVGSVSQPVKTQFGYHLIKVTDRK